jgi:hypothetical protein
MEKKSLWLTLGMLVLILVPITIYAVVVAGPAGSGKYDQFAQCLTDRGAKMYGAYWCAHCQNQKRLFGKSFSKIKYIECSLPGGQGQTQECTDAGISGYPTWEFGDGSRLDGEVSLETLAEKTECSLKGGE